MATSRATLLNHSLRFISAGRGGGSGKALRPANHVGKA
jgi:hypothetical protein